MLTSGRLFEILRSYAKTDNDSDSKVLWLALETLRAKSSELSEIAGFLNFYLNPQKFFCPFVKDMSSIESVIESSQGLQKLPRRFEDFTAVSDEYIIPKSIIDSAKNVSTYFSSLDQLNGLLQKNCLISRRIFPESEKKEIERLESASMSDYTEGLYKWQWGCDDATVALIDSLLKTNREEANSSSGLEKAGAELWIPYLEFLNRKTRPLSNEDKRILNGTTDDLNNYLSATLGHMEDFRVLSENYQREKQEHERLLELEAQGIRVNYLAKLRKFSMSFAVVTMWCNITAVAFSLYFCLSIAAKLCVSFFVLGPLGSLIFLPKIGLEIKKGLDRNFFFLRLPYSASNLPRGGNWFRNI